LEIAKALEAKRKDIEAFTKNQPPPKDQPTLQMGSFKVTDNLSNPIGGDFWSYESYSWNEAFSLYNQIKDQPVNLNWKALNRLVRGIVPDDEARIADGFFTQHHRLAGPIFADIRTKINDCLTQEQCTQPDLTLAQKDFLKSNWFFKFYLETLENTEVSHHKKKDYYLPRFLKRIKMEAEIYDFRVNPTIRVEGQSLFVPMNLSVLEDGIPLFIEILEKGWNTDPNINIKLIPTPASSPHYLLKVDDMVGGRAFVAHRSDGGSMQLFNLGSIKTALHEFGHVIGLTDEYYTKWNSQTCEYTTEFNEGNIMSDHNSGQALSSHWEAIKKHYWK
jgi:hypothetical protein